MAKLKTKSVLSYFGSDSEVAGQLAAILNHCKHVTIPFCGGLAILPNLTARAIVANDLHSDVINFYRYASGRYGDAARNQLIDRCQATLSHPDEVRLAADYLKPPFEPGLNRAWAFWTQCWVGRKGKGGTKDQGGPPSVRWTASGGTNASRLQAAAQDLREWVLQLQRCEFRSECFRELLPNVKDRPDNGLYIDPPWVDLGRNYQHAFTDQDHKDLQSMLKRFEYTTVVVRYGDHPLVRELYADWEIIEASSRDQCNAVQGELWITNRNLGRTQNE